MIKVKEAIIVEGKYDKIKLDQFIDGLIIPTDGFGIFKNKEKQALLRRLAAARGILILTDSDGAGMVIRNFLKGCLPASQIRHAYIPEIPGKEKRKTKPSAEGTLGVEGMTEEVLAKAIAASGAGCSLTEGRVRESQPVSKTDFFEWGLSGGPCSREKREHLQKAIGLPSQLSANALLQAVNFLMSREEFEAVCRDLFSEH